MARNQVLGMLLDTRGELAYRGMKSLASDGSIGSRAHRFKALARRMAERDADPTAWTVKAVRDFEISRLAPIATGRDLLNTAWGLLEDIAQRFRSADLSARAVVEGAADEAPVQHWLGGELRLAARDSFEVAPEAEVFGENRPDLVLTAHTTPFQVAIEVKNGRKKKWTVRALREALAVQLAEKYLKPASRRHGILVISNHGPRTWIHPETGGRLEFKMLIDLLQNHAETIRNNTEGAIEVRVFGIDAAPRPKAKVSKRIQG